MRPSGIAKRDPAPPDRDGESAAFVIAQDVTGRRWTLTTTDQGLSVWWSDDRAVVRGAGSARDARVGGAPRTGPIAAKGDVLWNCDRFRPESHGACSYSTDLGDAWHTTHLAR